MSSTGAGGGWRRLWRSLAGRIWLTSVLLVALMGALGVGIAARLAILEQSVNQVLSRNYRSIQAGNGMLAVIGAMRGGGLTRAQARSDFERLLNIQRHNETEPGESELTEAIAQQGGDFFAAPGSSASGATALEHSLAALITLNERAMFSADRHT